MLLCQIYDDDFIDFFFFIISHPDLEKLLTKAMETLVFFRESVGKMERMRHSITFARTQNCNR